MTSPTTSVEEIANGDAYRYTVWTQCWKVEHHVTLAEREGDPINFECYWNAVPEYSMYHVRIKLIV